MGFAMSTVRMILGVLACVIEQKQTRRKERVQCRPSGERMEPRALLSDLKVGVADLLPPHSAGGALVDHANPAPAFKVSYQLTGAGASTGINGIQNHFSVGDDVVDQGNVENQDPSGP
jgi:hypothetical protein